MARPKGSTKQPDENKLVFKLCLMGATDADLAQAFDVSERTINNWKTSKEGFFQSIKDGRQNADAEIANALYHRAKGYSHPEEKIFNNNGEEMRVETTKHYPPDTAAAFIWLKNRQPQNWRDKKESGEAEKGIAESLKEIAEKLPD